MGKRFGDSLLQVTLTQTEIDGAVDERRLGKGVCSRWCVLGMREASSVGE